MSAIDYTRVNFKNYPDTTTPITDQNLNKLDKGIYDLDVELTSTNNLLGTASQASGVTGATAFAKIAQLNSDLASEVTELYTNNSPTSMGTATLNLNDDVSNYKLLVILYDRELNKNYGDSAILYVQANGYTHPHRIYTYNDEGKLLFYRDIELRNDMYVELSAGFYRGIADVNSSWTVYTGCILPRKIYGIK